MISQYKTWDILISKIYYQDNNNYKYRPILLVDEINNIYCSLKITSNIKRTGLDECNIEYWKESGLKKPSNIRLNKFIIISQNSIIDKCGTLQYADRIKLIAQLKNLVLAYNVHYSKDIIDRLEKRIDENL